MKFCPSCAHALVERTIHGRLRPSCDHCGFVYYAGPKLAAGVIVECDGCIVLNRRAIDPGYGRWSFPSGYVDLGETPEAAAVREAREETGLDVTIDGLVGVYTNPERPVVLIVYAGHVMGGTLVAGDEVQEVGTFDLAALPPLAFAHDTRIINDWLTWQRHGNHA